MGVRGTSPSLPKDGQLKMACQSERQNIWWMWNYSWRGRLGGKQVASIALSYCMWCFSMPQSKGRKRQSVWSAEATNMTCQSWTLRQTYPLSSWWGTRPAERSSNPSAMKCTNSRGYQGLPKRVRTSGIGGVLLRRSPGAGEGQNATDNRGAQSNWCPAPKELDLQEGRRDAAVESSLTEVREAHRKALAMAAALEEEIEQLSCPLTRSQSEAQAHSQSRDHCRCRSRGQKRRCCQVWLEDCWAPYIKYHPSQRGSESKGDKEAPEDFN